MGSRFRIPEPGVSSFGRSLERCERSSTWSCTRSGSRLLPTISLEKKLSTQENPNREGGRCGALAVVGKPDFHKLAIDSAEALRTDPGRRLLLLPFHVLAELCVRVVEGRLAREALLVLLGSQGGYASLEKVEEILIS